MRGQFFTFPIKIPQNARVLVAPLDWGLGHATRCVPLIERLLSTYQAQISIAATGPQKMLLQQYFPQIPFLSPPEFKVSYHKNRAVTIGKLALSIPAFQRNIQAESDWIKLLLSRQKFDLLLSDNRYGICSKSVPSYFITHQLLVKTAFGNWADRLVQKQLYRYINRFTACLVPDYPQEPSLAGALSHPAKMPRVPIHYLGPISRILPMQPNAQTELLVILSGPEPQRSLLEQKILSQWAAHPGKSMVLVRGLPSSAELPGLLPNLTTHNFLSSGPLSQEIANAKAILCRSGYSSIMDLVPLEKKCFMVPTPGQTEQEYLAKYLSGTGRITAITQDALQVSRILECLT